MVLLAVASNDAPAAAALLRADWQATATDAEQQAASCVVNHDADRITCPACGHTFASGTPECPDCGLAVL